MNTPEHLKSILAEQVAAYRSLLELLQRERGCLININPAGVEALSKEKDTAILKLRLLDEERVRLADMCARERNVAGTPTLQQIADLTGDSAFAALRLQLISLLQSITEFNEFNRVLIERSSGVVTGALAFLNSFGVQQKPAGTGTLVSREA